MSELPSGKPGHRGITRLVKAYQNSIKGLAAGYKHEEAIRMEVWILLLGTLFLLFIDMALYERLAMWFCLMLLLTVEILNSAIEATVDRIGLEYHELSGRAKDLGSAAVFMAMVFSGVIWGVLLTRHFFF
jgi:diacylglycerol kinase (ATP)